MQYKQRIDYYPTWRAKVIEYLGGVCVKCGTTEALEFDHIDPSTKEWGVSSMWTYSWEVQLPEIEKCQLLCNSCHRDKHTVEAHGTIYMYTHGKCRCDSCRLAKARDYQNWRKSKNMPYKIL